MPRRRGEDADDEQRSGSGEPLIRPFMLVGNRTPTQDENDLDLATLVRTRDPAPSYASGRDIKLVERDILARCVTSVSIAELAGLLRLPVPIIQVLVGDLRREGCVVTSTQEFDHNDRPPMELLERVLRGLNELPVAP